MSKIVYYGSTTLSDEQYLSAVKLYALGLLPDVRMPVDRLGVYASPVPVSYDLIPLDYSSIKVLPLEVALYMATRELYSHNKPINILWSGGIDSTAALVALMLYRAPDDPPVKVIFNSNSVEEYPEYADFIAKNYNYFFCRDSSDYRYATYWAEGEMLTSGDCGDQLLGSRRALQLGLSFDDNWTNWFHDPDLILHGYDAFPPAIRSVYSRNQIASILSEEVPSIVESSLIKINNLFDFYWWCNFRFKYHAVRWKILTYIDGSALQPWMVKNYSPFYNSRALQRWSCLNHNLKHEGTELSYKAVLRSWIVNNLQHSSYAFKRKESSMPRITYETCTTSIVTRIYDDGSAEIFKP
jgi:hypothetical protein